MSQVDTKQRILDAAEHLFARQGFHGTSLRAITTRAKANLAAVNYHFGSKEALLDAVFDRRLIPLNEARRQRIEAVRAAAHDQGGATSVEAALRAFIEPTFQFRDAGGTDDFVTLVGRAISEPDEVLSRSFIEHVEPIIHLMLAVLQEALPDLSPNAVFWRLQFALGAISHTMRMRQWARYLPEGIDLNGDAGRLVDDLLAFVCAGVAREE